MEAERRRLLKDGAHRNGIRESEYMDTWDYFFKAFYIYSDSLDRKTDSAREDA